MLFKRKHDNEIEKEETESEAAEQLEVKWQKQIKKLNRKHRLRLIAGILFIAVITIGSLRSLFIRPVQSNYALAANDYHFIEEYISHYFHYPQNETDSTYMQTFSVNPAWKAEFDLNSVDQVQVMDTNVFQVNQEVNYTKAYYTGIRLKLHYKDGREEEKNVQAKITAAEIDQRYLVTKPLEMVYTNTLGMSEDEKKGYVQTNEMKGSDCSDSEKQELQNTIQLFLKTYMSDYAQARLLMQNPDQLDRMDANTAIQLTAVNSARKTDDSYLADANVVYITSEVIRQTRTLHFEIDQKTNKIIRLERF